MTDKYYRSVFISDVHLGSRGCRAEELHDFLSTIECSYLFLVGDIIDIWRMRSKWYWPHSHSKIVRKLIKLSKKTRVIFIPGNHDEMFRQFAGMKFGEIEIVAEAEHKLSGNRRVLVLHGDRFDHVICHHKWLAIVGAHAYELLIWVNRIFNKVRKMFGFKYWSLAGYLKIKAKKAVKIINNFEQAVTTHASNEGYDYVVTGHIHQAAIKKTNGVTYLNCGDWVESCTAVVETQDGKLKLIHV